MFLKAAINGSRQFGVPLRPEDQARAARDAVGAGANAIHAHIRDSAGFESLDAEDAAALVRALREAVPATPIGVSTGAWIVKDPVERTRVIGLWKELPDFASVNFSEDGAEDVANVLLRHGVGVEAGLSDARDATRLVKSGLALRCLRVLLEPQEQDLGAALRNVDGMEEVLDLAENPLARLLHGVDATAWPLLVEARRRGHGARIGLEDTILLPDGSPAPDSAALVMAAMR
jgi:uncharacterized protein (DUF849 family)